jgi:hypothetical protein
VFLSSRWNGAADFSDPMLNVVSGPVGECSERARRRHPCRVPPASEPAGDDLAQARCVPPKHERAGVVGDRRDGHDFFARFCLIRSGCTQRIPAVRARRIAGPRP